MRDLHTTLRRSRTRFNSWQGHFDAGARRHGDCLQSSSKRVRLPPASLRLSGEPPSNKCVLERQPNCPSGLHQHPVTVCRKARCLGNPSLGDSFGEEMIQKQQHRQANCRSGVHDGPKVATPGDRLSEWRHESLRDDCCQSTVGNAEPIRTAANRMHSLAGQFVGSLISKTIAATAGMEYIARSDGKPGRRNHVSLGVRVPHRIVSGRYLVAVFRNTTDCRLGVHGSRPGGRGCKSRRRNFAGNCRAVAQ